MKFSNIYTRLLNSFAISFKKIFNKNNKAQHVGLYFHIHSIHKLKKQIWKKINN